MAARMSGKEHARRLPFVAVCAQNARSAGAGGGKRRRYVLAFRLCGLERRGVRLLLLLEGLVFLVYLLLVLLGRLAAAAAAAEEEGLGIGWRWM